jgi:hypothetical protein
MGSGTQPGPSHRRRTGDDRPIAGAWNEGDMAPRSPASRMTPGTPGLPTRSTTRPAGSLRVLRRRRSSTMRMAWHTILFDRDEQTGRGRIHVCGHEHLPRRRGDPAPGRPDRELARISGPIQPRSGSVHRPQPVLSGPHLGHAANHAARGPMSWVRAKDVHFPQMRSPST